MSYVLAKSQNEDIHKAGECGGAVTSILKYLLDEGIVDGVLAITPCEDVYDGTPTFITNSYSSIVLANSYPNPLPFSSTLPSSPYH